MNKNKYQATLNLPKTDFPMRANLKEKEIALLSQWESERLYTQISAKPAPRKYILHDGPPYANGRIHIGHALNKILKDIVIKSKTMEGFHAPFVPGWDCHGLPIEHQVQKELGPKREGMSKLAIRNRCREYAQKFIAIQKEEFKRLGVLGDWENPYLTLTPTYEAAIVREFGKVVAAGPVYKGLKPVLWCAHDETALAEAEVEYQDKTSPSIYVKFPVVKSDGLFSEEAAVVIWTTTPWTLVANQAISVHPDFNYHLIGTPLGNLILAGDLMESCLTAFGFESSDMKPLKQFRGKELADRGLLCRHPWLDRIVPVIAGEHVTKDQGTGLVHTAPGHGQEDYEIGLKYQLNVYAPVDEKGRFTADVEQFAGMKVFEANPAIIARLKEGEKLLKEEKLVHSYPHCWRCKQPVLFRATEQWFVSMEKTNLRDRALAEIEKVRWIPKWGKDRIVGAVSNRPDWCISRQRAWGVPIVAFTCSDCGKNLLSQKIADHVAGIMEREGSDIWFSGSAEALLPAGTRCPHCQGNRFDRENDILDVWFESGVSHAAVLRSRPELSWPADLYLEGSDQHRGWFQSTLLASLSTDHTPAFRAVLTHGFTVDGEGKKMSKSSGNVVAPQEVADRYGAEILRLWVAATDFRDDVRISDSILQQLVEAYRKIRNTCRFLMGNLYDYTPQAISEAEYLEVDRWALYRLDLLNQKIRRAYEEMEFHIVFHALNQFSAVDLSAFYLDILKDRLYASSADDPGRRAAQSVLHEILITLTKLMAPILSFTAEEIWQALPAPLREEARSIHLTTFPEGIKRYVELADTWERLMAIRNEVSKALEEARQAKRIGSSLAAKVSLACGAASFSLLKKRNDFLPALFIVSEVELKFVEGSPDLLQATVAPAEGVKCERCWLFSNTVGSDAAHPTLCKRCAAVVGGFA